MKSIHRKMSGHRLVCKVHCTVYKSVDEIEHLSDVVCIVGVKSFQNKTVHLNEVFVFNRPYLIGSAAFCQTSQMHVQCEYSTTMSFFQ